MMASLAGHSILPDLYSAMQHPDHYLKVVNVTFAVCMTYFVTVAALGYHMYGDKTRSEIELNFGAGWGRFSQLVILLLVICKFGGFMNALSLAVEVASNPICVLPRAAPIPHLTPAPQHTNTPYLPPLSPLPCLSSSHNLLPCRGIWLDSAAMPRSCGCTQRHGHTQMDSLNASPGAGTVEATEPLPHFPRGPRAAGQVSDLDIEHWQRIPRTQSLWPNGMLPIRGYSSLAKGRW